MRKTLATTIGFVCFGVGTAAAQLNPAAGNKTSCPSGYNVIEGTPGDDNLRGTSGNDCILGGAGNDRIDGRSGDDILIGGEGDDRLVGGQGDDLVYGGAGDDDLFGGRGADSLFGGADNDSVRGDRGNDTLFGGSGDDELRSGGGDDVVDGGEGSDGLFGGANGDILVGGGGDDSLRGRAGNDHLLGGEGTNVLRGDQGVDTCDLSLCGGDANAASHGSVFLVSKMPNRSRPQAASGNWVTGDIFAFIPDNGIQSVRFFLDAPDLSGNPVSVISRAPWDYCGTQANGDAAPFPTVRFAPSGRHVLSAEIHHTDGTTEVLHAVITVEN